MKELFLYHSFPRRAGPDALAKGFDIFRLILDQGLLLTPERVVFKEALADGSFGNEAWIYQKRVCFTELTPNELTVHAKQFGVFSFEWDVPMLKRLGAIPVFYVPLVATMESLAGSGAAMLARLGEVQKLLVRIETLKSVLKTSDPNQLLLSTTNGSVTSVSRCTVAAASDLIAVLEREIQPVESLAASVRAMFGYFYPTENLDYTTELGYYQQREWRILANLLHLGSPIMTATTQEDIDRLGELDKEFFLHEMDFQTGRHTLAAQSQYFKSFRGQEIALCARRFICPEEIVQKVEAELTMRGIQMNVVPLESIT